MKYKMKTVLFCGALAMGAALATPANAAEVPKDMNFTITKGGDPIGTHTFKFSKRGARMTVNVETHTKVNVLFLKFTYDHKRTETWNDAKLVGLKSKTDDDGTPHKVNIRAKGGTIAGTADDKPASIDGMALPVTFWNAEILNKPVLFSALDGHDYHLEWKQLPDESVKVEGSMVNAKVYEMSGELERKLWYSADGEFLKTKFVKKGYDIEWIRE